MENKNKSANKDKVAIVTGSATGIGYDTAIHLAKNGFHTYASMRNLPKADEITKIAKSENLPLCVIQLDVTDDISINKAIDTVINESGKVDVLVNNAGYGLIGSIEDTSIEELKAQYETNVFGVEEMLKHRLYPEEVAKTVIQAIENPKPKLRYIVGKDAEELIELRRKSSDEELFWIIGQSVLKKEEQVFLHNRGQVGGQEQFRIKKVTVDGGHTAI